MDPHEKRIALDMEQQQEIVILKALLKHMIRMLREMMSQSAVINYWKISYEIMQQRRLVPPKNYKVIRNTSNMRIIMQAQKYVVFLEAIDNAEEFLEYKIQPSKEWMDQHGF